MQTEHMIVCPWCEKGEVYAKGIGRVSATVRCSKCRHVFRINFETYTAEKTSARRKMKQGAVQ